MKEIFGQMNRSKAIMLCILFLVSLALVTGYSRYNDVWIRGWLNVSNDSVQHNVAGNLSIGMPLSNNWSNVTITDNQISNLSYTNDTDTRWDVNTSVFRNETGVLGILKSWWDNLYAGIQWAYNQTTEAITNMENESIIRAKVNDSWRIGNCSVDGSCSAIVYATNTSWNVNTTEEMVYAIRANVMNSTYSGDRVFFNFYT